MLEENPALTLDRLVELKYSTRVGLADRVLDDLIAAARNAGDPKAHDAAEVLAGWDRQAEPESTGALLFFSWVGALPATDPATLSDLFATPGDPTDPLGTPAGLKDPAGAVRALVAAANNVAGTFGRLDTPWGEVARLSRGGVDLPANGSPGDPFGVFRVLEFDFAALVRERRTEALAGDSFVAAVAFGDPVRARVLLGYGNASQPGSPHVGDQLALSAAGQLRPAWRTRAEIEANLEAREVLAGGSSAPASGSVATPESG
jgi:acyl-homoserine-lactone acylase